MEEHEMKGHRKRLGRKTVKCRLSTGRVDKNWGGGWKKKSWWKEDEEEENMAGVGSRWKSNLTSLARSYFRVGRGQTSGGWDGKLQLCSCDLRWKRRWRQEKYRLIESEEMSSHRRNRRGPNDSRFCVTAPRTNNKHARKNKQKSRLQKTLIGSAGCCKCVGGCVSPYGSR